MRSNGFKRDFSLTLPQSSACCSFRRYWLFRRLLFTRERPSPFFNLLRPVILRTR